MSMYSALEVRVPFSSSVICGAVLLGPAESVDMAHVDIDKVHHRGAGLLDFGSQLLIGKFAKGCQFTAVGFEISPIHHITQIDYSILGAHGML